MRPQLLFTGLLAGALGLSMIGSAFAAADHSKRRFKSTVYSKHWHDDYDRYFRKYAKRYFGPGLRWRWFKAQAIAESGLNPKAKSPAGAVGVMQILPSTYSDILKANPQFRYLVEPRWNIAAGIYYDRQLYKHWIKKLPSNNDRIAFALASYNAGLGTILKSWKRSGAHKNPREGRHWSNIERYTPKETQAYVARIQALMEAR